jgi:hypothetical protein
MLANALSASVFLGGHRSGWNALSPVRQFVERRLSPRPPSRFELSCLAISRFVTVRTHLELCHRFWAQERNAFGEPDCYFEGGADPLGASLMREGVLLESK